MVYGYLPNQRSVLFARKDLDYSKDPVLGLAAMSNPAKIEFLAPLFVIVCLKRKTSTCAVTPQQNDARFSIPVGFDYRPIAMLAELGCTFSRRT